MPAPTDLGASLRLLFYYWSYRLRASRWRTCVCRPGAHAFTREGQGKAGVRKPGSSFFRV